MGRIIKCGLFDGYARLALIDLTDIVNEEIKIHDLSPLATAALGRSMLAGAYVGNNLKSDDNTYSITINGGGPLGPIVVAGGYGKIRGYVTDNKVNLPLKQDGHLDVGGGVGKDGYISVVKDLGLKDPYVGRSELISGEIAEDFAKYLLISEGIRSAVAFGVKVNKDGCVTACGIVVEALPGITEDMLVMLEDVMSNFTALSDITEKKSIEEVYDFYFSHLDATVYETEEIVLKCNCSYERIKNLVKIIGKSECEQIIAEQGKIEAVCHFCEKKYAFNKEDVEKLWDK